MKPSEFIYNSQGKLLVNEYGEIMLPRRAIVRCRDCQEYNTELYKHITCELFMRYVEPDGFCAWGERGD